MSWQDYVDNQLMASQCVTKACIAGHDGNVWASSKGFEVSYRFSIFIIILKTKKYGGKLIFVTSSLCSIKYMKWLSYLKKKNL